MKKRRLLYIVSTIASVSIALNFMFWKMHVHVWGEKERLNKSPWDLQSVSYPNFDYYIKLEQVSELSSYKEDTVILTANSTIKNLLTIMTELVNNCGGVEGESQRFVNPYAVKQVQNYFYGYNNFRNNAIDHFNEILDQYQCMSKKFDVSPELVRNLNVREDISENRLFESMTLIESVSFLNSICFIITIDTNNYIMKNALS